MSYVIDQLRYDMKLKTISLTHYSKDIDLFTNNCNNNPEKQADFVSGKILQHYHFFRRIKVNR